MLFFIIFDEQFPYLCIWFLSPIIHLKLVCFYGLESMFLLGSQSHQIRQNKKKIKFCCFIQIQLQKKQFRQFDLGHPEDTSYQTRCIPFGNAFSNSSPWFPSFFFFFYITYTTAFRFSRRQIWISFRREIYGRLPVSISFCQFPLECRLFHRQLGQHLSWVSVPVS